MDNVWIGLTDGYTGNWEWIDGTPCDYTSTGNCIDDPHWSVGEPNNYKGVEHYVEIRPSDYRYNDAPCISEQKFLCNNPRYTGTYTNFSNTTRTLAS